jgi:hypothetical protein
MSQIFAHRVALFGRTLFKDFMQHLVFQALVDRRVRDETRSLDRDIGRDGILSDQCGQTFRRPHRRAGIFEQTGEIQRCLRLAADFCQHGSFEELQLRVCGPTLDGRIEQLRGVVEPPGLQRGCDGRGGITPGRRHSRSRFLAHDAREVLSQIRLS